eukprot:7017620-Pyramimonas_sp.AAC.1
MRGRASRGGIASVSPCFVPRAAGRGPRLTRQGCGGHQDGQGGLAGTSGGAGAQRIFEACRRPQTLGPF